MSECDCGRPLVCLCGDLASDHQPPFLCEYFAHGMWARCPGGCDDHVCPSCGGTGHDGFLPPDEDPGSSECVACGGSGERAQ